MSKEQTTFTPSESPNIQNTQKNRPPFLARAVAATLPIYAFVPSASHEPPETCVPSDTVLEIQSIDDLKPTHEQKKGTVTGTADENISDFLSDDFIRLATGAITLYGLASIYRSHEYGKKYHDTLMRRLGESAPTLFTLASATALLDSYETIDRHIPAGLILGYTLAQAGYNLMTTLERESSNQPYDLRKSAYVASGALIAVGTTLFIAAHNA